MSDELTRIRRLLAQDGWANAAALATLRTGPAPSRLRESTSTNPSRQSESLLSGTSNGATAIRSGLSKTAPYAWTNA